ncbi:MAG: hypothetical protein IRZ05_13105 [Micromonosporaceae bacterium]|nr:hypothetical protein [Micromonosporaceae bacterium]
MDARRYDLIAGALRAVIRYRQARLAALRNNEPEPLYPDPDGYAAGLAHLADMIEQVGPDAVRADPDAPIWRAASRLLLATGETIRACPYEPVRRRILREHERLQHAVSELGLALHADGTAAVVDLAA